MGRKPTVLFLINSLAAGGAERQLTVLARGMDSMRFDLHVVVMYDPGYHNHGELWPEIATIPGVSLHSLHKRKGMLGYLTALPRLARLVRRTKPDLLHGYLQGNLAVLLIGSALRKPIVWGIRRTSADFTKMDRLSRGLLRVEVWLSRFTDLIIFNSEAGFRNHLAMGMRSARMKVVPNGFDTGQFRPDPAKGRAQRQVWGVPDGVPLIGLAGRLDPVKDHPTFLRMAARLRQTFGDAWFVCMGDGGAAYLKSLQAMAAGLGIADRVLWPGVCLDMSSAYNALSLLALTSTDEGFPNVLGEAMACGIPCLSTPAGDAARLVGETGKLCDFGDDGALAEAATNLLREPAEARTARAGACRTRVVTHFSIEALVKETENALLEVLRKTPPLRPPVNGQEPGPGPATAGSTFHVSRG